MRTWSGFIAVWGLLVVLTCWVPAAMAQDPAAPEDPAPAEPPADITGQEFEAQKFHFGLYVSVAAGSGDSDPLETDIAAGPLDLAVSTVELTDQIYGRAAIGWQLKDVRKGDFRLVTQGLREEEYEFNSAGITSTEFTAPWWFIQSINGDFIAERFVPTFDLGLDDGDGVAEFAPCMDVGNGITQCGEITYGAPDRVIDGQITDDLQNQIQTFDALYGREFGGRRFSSRWWTGLRYFNYEGQLLAAAWLNLDTPGENFTDGSFLNLLRFTQETSGFGPVGTWEADFNFFDRGLVLFLRGEAAFTFNSMTMDSGPFFRIAQEGDSSNPAVLVPDRMGKDLEKSTWQTKGEVGARINFKNGLQIEAAWSRTGYLDIVLMPNLLQLGGPQVTNDNPQTYTQDLVVDLIHAGVGFQF